MLKIADPDGWMSVRSIKVVAAKSLAVKALQKSLKTEPAVVIASKVDVFVEEMEEDEEEEGAEVAPAAVEAPPAVDPGVGKEHGCLMIRKPQNRPWRLLLQNSSWPT